MKGLQFLLVILVVIPRSGLPAVAGFQKLTDHFFFYQPSGDQPNVGAFVGDSGVLLVNPPCDTVALAPVLDALKRVSSKPVRWAVRTDHGVEGLGCPAQLREQGTLVLLSKASFERGRPDGVPTDVPAGRGSLVFTRQLRLFESTVEVRIFAPQVKPPSGDVVVFVPTERVLHVGRLFRPATFPRIEDTAPQGAALAWIDALEQVFELVPLLKSAMPQPKPDPAKPEEEEKTLEELVTVVPGSGSVSNLQDMKDLLESARRMRSDVTRAVRAGRKRDAILASLSAYRSMTNFEEFALSLYDAVAAREKR